MVGTHQYRLRNKTKLQPPQASELNDKTMAEPKEEPKKNATKPNRTHLAMAKKQEKKDMFRVMRGVLPRSRDSSPVTDEMREELELKFYLIMDDQLQKEFTQLLRETTGDEPWKYIRWIGHRQDIKFNELPDAVVRDMFVFLAVYDLTEDIHGERKRLKRLQRKVLEIQERLEKEREAAMERVKVEEEEV